VDKLLRSALAGIFITPIEIEYFIFKNTEYSFPQSTVDILFLLLITEDSHLFCLNKF